MKEHTFDILPVLSAIVFFIDFFTLFLLVVTRMHIFCGVFHEIFTFRVLGESIGVVIFAFDELDFDDSIFDLISGVLVSSVDVFRTIRQCCIVSQIDCSNIVDMHDNW